jgi:hypothetical protein
MKQATSFTDEDRTQNKKGTFQRYPEDAICEIQSHLLPQIGTRAALGTQSPACPSAPKKHLAFQPLLASPNLLHGPLDTPHQSRPQLFFFPPPWMKGPGWFLLYAHKNS